MSYNANGDVTKATLAYIPIVGIILFIIEKEDNYVRYHAMQSILWMAVGLILLILLRILELIFVPRTLDAAIYYVTTGGGFIVILSWILWLAYIAVIIYSMLKAYKGAWHKLPVIGDMAMRIVNK